MHLLHLNVLDRNIALFQLMPLPLSLSSNYGHGINNSNNNYNGDNSDTIVISTHRIITVLPRDRVHSQVRVRHETMTIAKLNYRVDDDVYDKDEGDKEER